jgi:hypothetical protein
MGRRLAANTMPFDCHFTSLADRSVFNGRLYRLLHFVVFAFFVVRLLPRDWPGLEWRIFRPTIKCGQQSLEVFCSGIFLSFAAHFVLVEISGAIWMQIVVSIAGILMMTALAYYRSWSKNADKAPTKIKPIVAAAA